MPKGFLQPTTSSKPLTQGSDPFIGLLSHLFKGSFKPPIHQAFDPFNQKLLQIVHSFGPTSSMTTLSPIPLQQITTDHRLINSSSTISDIHSKIRMNSLPPTVGKGREHYRFRKHLNLSLCLYESDNRLEFCIFELKNVAIKPNCCILLPSRLFSSSESRDKAYKLSCRFIYQLDSVKTF